jgi:hypothetical protein
MKEVMRKVRIRLKSTEYGASLPLHCRSKAYQTQPLHSYSKYNFLARKLKFHGGFICCKVPAPVEDSVEFVMLNVEFPLRW